MVSRAMSVVALVAMAAVSVVAAEEVVTLTGDNFDKWVGEQDFTVVEFYAPWCGHCKKLAPEYEKAAAELKKLDPPILLAKVDATEDKNKELGSRFGIRGFPTMKIFRKGEKEQDYNGPREADGIVDYVKKMSGPAAQKFSSKADAEKFVKDQDVAVIGAFKEGSDELAAFLKAASDSREDGNFAYVLDAAHLPASKNLNSKAAVHVYKKFDDEYAAYEGEMESKAITEFVNNESTALVTTFDQAPENRNRLGKVFASDKAKMLAFVKFDDKEAEANMRRALNEAAPNHKDKVNVLIADFKDNDRALEFFGLSASNTVPTVVIHSMADNKKFVEEIGSDFSKVAKFMEGFSAGTLEAHLKSEDVPEKNDGDVLVVVGKSFEEVLGSGKDVMIEFYAPWCGHCKKLAPIYDEVGATFKGNDKVVVAKFDATANDVPDSKFDVKGFPTLYFKNGKTGEISQYDGAREKDAIIKYMKEKGAFAA